LTSERRWGKLVGRVGEARLDTLQVKARVSEVLHVIMLMEARQVAVIMVLLEVLVQVVVFVVKAFVVREVLLFSLSSTSFPRTRPAARVWA